MIDNLIFGGIGFIGGFFAGFMLAGLLVSAKKYEGYDDDR